VTGENHCEACGETNPVATQSCTRCGAPLADHEPGGALTAAEPAVVVQVGSEADTHLLSLAGTTECRRAPGRTPAPRPRYAGFVSRAAAFLIDGAVLGLFALPLAAAGFASVRAGLAALGLPPPAGTEDALRSLLACGWLAMATIYFTTLHAGSGQTIGKALLCIRVRSNALSDIGTMRSLVRSVGYLTSSTFCGLGFLMVAITPSKRGWHDYLAGTCVVCLAPNEA